MEMAMRVMMDPRFKQSAAELVVALGRSDEVTFTIPIGCMSVHIYIFDGRAKWYYMHIFM